MRTRCTLSRLARTLHSTPRTDADLQSAKADFVLFQRRVSNPSNIQPVAKSDLS